ncbi:MAG: UvrD-helicase domain-containing protein [Blastocatellia bacterium]|nr:UvrD-helicase domain-containing protein [Blastocatellia bacterium]
MNYLTLLNERQRQAVTNTGGPLLVVAGAGSGKTRVIAYRIAYLIDHLGIEPSRILAVTFTNKAADEMRHRVEQILEGRLSGQPWVSTFHSFCVRLLRQHLDGTEGYTPHFSIYDDDDSQRVIKAAIADLEIDEQILSLRAIQAAISHAKSRGMQAADYQVAHGSDARKAVVAKVFQLYEQRLRAANALDFDDLLLKTVQLLRRDKALREHYNERFQHILVDEYQDINRPQFNLIRLLTEKQQNLCVVGDPDQSIYKFRGADIQNIIDFQAHYPTATVITLDQNYRSTQRILRVANHVIRHNRQRPDKSLRTENEDGPRVAYYHAFNGEEEAWFVARTIKQHLEQPQDGSKCRVAVLYRTNAQSRLFEEACRREQIRFNIVGGFSFYKRAEVRDVVAYVKAALNARDDESLRRIINTPPRGIGQKTLEAIDAVARQRNLSLWDTLTLMLAQQKLPARSLQPLQAFHELIEHLASLARTGSTSAVIRAAMEETGYVRALKQKSLSAADALDAENRLLNLEELLSAATEAEERGESLRDFIDHAALVSDADDYEPDASVTLMTMHSAKGLEFNVVFIVGLENGLFPHARSTDDPAELEEERRLCYVAITRAQQQLYVTHARSRRLRGEEISCEPSLFLQEMPLDELEDLSNGPSWLQTCAPPTRSHIAAVTTKPTRPFQGKTYNSVESLQGFFKQKGINVNIEKPASRKTAAGQQSGLAVGSRVRHPKYGVGQVIHCEDQGDDVKLTIRFPGFGDRKMLQRLAQLEKL